MSQPNNSNPNSPAALRPENRSDLRTIEQSARNHWPVPSQLREAAVTRLAMILADSQQPARMHVAAIRALAELDKANLLREQLELDRDPDSRRPVVNVTARVDLTDLRQMDDEELRKLLDQKPSDADPWGDDSDDSA